MSLKMSTGLAMLLYVALYLASGCIREKRFPMPQSQYVPHTEEWPMGQKAVLTIFDDARGNRVGRMLVREAPQVTQNDDGTWEIVLK